MTLLYFLLYFNCSQNYDTVKIRNSVFLLYFTDLNVWVKNTDFLDYVPCFFQKTGIKSSNIEQHNMEGGKVNTEQKQVTMC
jgi:hypothetical protein